MKNARRDRSVSMFLMALALYGCGGNAPDITPSPPAASMAAPEAAAPSPDLSTSQDVIVVFDDASVQSEWEGRRSARNLAASDTGLQSWRATRLSALKADVLQNFRVGEASTQRAYSHLPLSQMRVHSAQALARLKAHPGVSGVYPNGQLRKASLAQGLALIGQPIATGALGVGLPANAGKDVGIAILDQRVDYTRPEFGSCRTATATSGCKVIVAMDAPGVIDDGLGYQDGHGTQSAATALAVAPGAKIVSINVFNGDMARDSDVLAAINWSIENAAKYSIGVINLGAASEATYGIAVTQGPYFTAFAQARALGIVPVVAAGNAANAQQLSVPAAVSGAVSVGAVYDGAYGAMRFPSAGCSDASTAADQIACFSNSSRFLTVWAPGCRSEAGLADTSRYLCGTSQASAYVAGAMAVLRKRYGGESVAQTVARLNQGPLLVDRRNAGTVPRLSMTATSAIPACPFTVPSALSAPPTGLNLSSFDVSTIPGCTWTVESNVNWLTVLQGSPGISNGTVYFSVAPYNGVTPRTGILTLGSNSIAVTQFSVGGGSSSSNIWLMGNYDVAQASTSSARLTADRIFNDGFDFQLQPRAELVLSTKPYALATTTWSVANTLLAGGSPWLPATSRSLDATVSLFNLPKPGTYYATLVISSYRPGSCKSADGYCVLTWGSVNAPFFVTDEVPPTTPSNVTAAARSSTRIEMNWAAANDDGGIGSYRLYRNGQSAGAVTQPTATLAGLTPGVTTTFTVSACDPAGNCSPAVAAPPLATPAFDPESGWWWNPAESGRGYFIEATNGRVFEATFMYLDGSRPLWYAVGPTALDSNTLTGTLNYFHGGQMLGGSYQAPSAPVASGPFNLSFSDARHATLNWPGGTTPLIRYVFGSGSALSSAPQTGWYWNPDESGRGFAVEIQGDAYFVAAFMYDADGSPSWYFASGQMTDSSHLSGIWQSCQGGQGMNGTYKAPDCSRLPNATFGFEFTTPTTANLTLGTAAPIPLVRYPF